MLLSLAHTPIELSKEYRRRILNDCIACLVQRYPLPLRLSILQSIPAAVISLTIEDHKQSPFMSMNETFDLKDIDSNILTAIIHLFKDSILKELSNIHSPNSGGESQIILFVDFIRSEHLCIFNIKDGQNDIKSFGLAC